MSHEIESNFVSDWSSEATQCFNCTSFEEHAGVGFCTEAQSDVSPTSHCDFFQSKD
ncbi:MAG: hypothetical protein WC564_00480 [Patescibacteria group bacterium]|jgi:hypothetical protein